MHCLHVSYQRLSTRRVEHPVECAVSISGYHFNPYTDDFYVCIVSNRFQSSERNPGYRDFLIECNCFLLFFFSMHHWIISLGDILCWLLHTNEVCSWQMLLQFSRRVKKKTLVTTGLLVCLRFLMKLHRRLFLELLKNTLKGSAVIGCCQHGFTQWGNPA